MPEADGATERGDLNEEMKVPENTLENAINQAANVNPLEEHTDMPELTNVVVINDVSILGESVFQFDKPPVLKQPDGVTPLGEYDAEGIYNPVPGMDPYEFKRTSTKTKPKSRTGKPSPAKIEIIQPKIRRQIRKPGNEPMTTA